MLSLVQLALMNSPISVYAVSEFVLAGKKTNPATGQTTSAAVVLTIEYFLID